MMVRDRSFQLAMFRENLAVLLCGFVLLLPLYFLEMKNVVWTAVFIMFLWQTAVFDYLYGRIYNKILLAAAAAELLYLLCFRPEEITASLLAGLCAAGVMYLIRVFSHGGMGLGDIKYVFVLVLGLGLVQGFFMLLAAFLAGGIFACFLLLFRSCKKTDAVPFAPFLSLGAYLALFWGEKLWNLWLTV